MSTERRSIGKFAVLGAIVALALLFTALSGGSALAARGGNSLGTCKGGPKHGCGGTTTATVTVTPNPVPVGSTFMTISGSGFGANQSLAVEVVGLCCFIPVTTDSSGGFTLTYYSSRLFVAAGSYTVEVWNSSGPLASTTFTVQ